MNFLNLNLQPEDKVGYEQKLEELKKPSIPAGKLIKLLLVNFDSTKAAYERCALEKRDPTILDGISLEYVALGYYKNAKEYVPIIKVDNIDANGRIIKPDVSSVEFPFSDDNYIGVQVFQTFTSKSLVFAGYKVPSNEHDATILFNQWLEREIGVPATADKKVGMIVHARRYIDHYYKKADKNADGTPKAGAQEQTSFKLTSFNREADENQPVAVEYFDDDAVAKIGVEVVKHLAAHKKDDPGKTGETPF